MEPEGRRSQAVTQVKGLSPEMVHEFWRSTHSKLREDRIAVAVKGEDAATPTGSETAA